MGDDNGAAPKPTQSRVSEAREVGVTPDLPKPAPGPGPATVFQYEPLPFDNPVDFHKLFWPDLTLFRWQEETLYQLAGFVDGTELSDIAPPTKEAPLQYSLVAANGSGKSAIIIARFALWVIATQRDSIAVVTSATFQQLKDLTFRAIHKAAQDVNDLLGEEFFICTEIKVECGKTRSIIRGFATDQPGRAEGWHPDHGGKLAVIIDEAKTITDEMFTAFQRFHGFSSWLEVSSPGPMMGHFFQRNSLATQTANKEHTDKLVLGKVYSRQVTAFECPGAVPQASIDQLALLHGTDSAVYRSSILAEFTSLEDGAIIRTEVCQYPDPPIVTFDLARHAGLDLSLGGDETVLSVWHGNEFVKEEIAHIEDGDKLAAWCVDKFTRHGLSAENINADGGGGIGRLIIQKLHALGWLVNEINNESPANNKSKFLNRGMEMYWKVLRLVEEKILRMSKVRANNVLLTQLTTRQAVYSSGKLKLQPKKELSTSPDRADAMVLAFAGWDLADILLKWQQAKLAMQPARVLSKEELNAKFFERIEQHLRDCDFAEASARETAKPRFRSSLAHGKRTSGFHNYLRRPQTIGIS